MNVKKYLGDLNGGGLLMTESRIVAEIQLKMCFERPAPRGFAISIAWNSLLIKK